MGRANLAEALRQIEISLPLWRESRLAAGEQVAEAWQLYLLGIKSGLDGRYGESREQFEKARAIFMEVGNAVPALAETTRWLMDLAEDQTIFASMMDLMLNRDEYTKRGGEVNQRLADLKQRALPGLRPYYEGLGHLFRATRLFDEAGVRIEAWDHAAAARILDDAHAALAEARKGVPAVSSEMRRAQLQDTIDGWDQAVEAERHHARALDALLERGDTGEARAELIDGAQGYRRALAAFEIAGLGSGATGSVQSSSARLNERARVMAAAFGPTQAMIGVGKVFFVFFFVALGVLTWLKPRLGLDGKLILRITLVVAVIGAFGLRAPDILNTLKSLPPLK